MATESIITVYRSTTNDTPPSGLTFGELAYSDLNGKFFVGRNNGTALWVGAQVTSGTITSDPGAAYLVPTQSAVKSYVDGVVGGGSVVNSVNGSSGAITLTGDGGAISNVQTNGANVVRARLATTGVTGVASFNNTRFTVSAAGAVDLAAAYQVTGDTVAAVGSATVSRSNNVATIDNRIASTSLTGVASFNNTRFTVSAAGAVDLAAAYQVTGDTVVAGAGIALSSAGNAETIINTGVLSLNGLTGARTLTGDGGALLGVGNDTIRARLATTGVTGVASFSIDNFAVSAAGAVTIKDGGVANAELVNSSITVKATAGDAGQALALGETLVFEGTSNEVNVSRSERTITIGLPDDVVITGNLTVNGTVVTANVDNFTVEDPLIVLGTGNGGDSFDLGFVGKYTSGGVKFTGLFRDAGDSGKYKLFTGLQEEPSTFVNVNGTGYTIGTLVARIDGGTF